MQTILLEIQSTDPTKLVSTMLGDGAERGSEAQIGDVAVRYEGIEQVRDVGVPEIVVFLLGIPVGITVNVIADMIGRYLQQKAREKELPEIVEVGIRLHEEIEITDNGGTRTTRRVSYQVLPIRFGQE